MMIYYYLKIFIFKFQFIFNILNSFFRRILKVDNSNKIIVQHCLTDRKSSTLELAKKYKQLYGMDVAFEFYASS